MASPANDATEVSRNSMIMTMEMSMAPAHRKWKTVRVKHVHEVCEQAWHNASKRSRGR